MIVTNAELKVALGLAASATDAQEALIDLVLPGAHSSVAEFLCYDPEQGSRTEFLPVIGADEHASVADLWRSDGTRAFRTRESQGVELLQVATLPIRSITNLYEDYNARHGANTGAFAAATELTEGEGFWPEYDGVDSDAASVCRSGLIRRVGGAWPTIPGTVKVVYVGGYDADELNGTDTAINARPIKDAILMTAMKAFREMTILGKQDHGFAAGPKSSERLGDYQYSLASSPGVVAAASMGIDLTAQAMAKLQRFRNMGESFR